MKIVHCCFGMEHYLDTWGYQQNILPMYHAKMGHETTVLASNDTFPTMAGGKLVEEIKSKGDNYFNDLVFVRRSSSYFPKLLHFQKAKGLIHILEMEKPDIIFFHGSLNLSIFSCVRYKKLHPQISLFVDSHADVMNVNTNKFYRWAFFKVYWSLLHRYCQKSVDKYFGVTIGRCAFLEKYFHIAPNKIELLPIGADVDAARMVTETKNDLRIKYGLREDDIILVHGGKLDARKGTVDLINAYRALKQNGYQKVRLILFGKIEDSRIPSLLSDDIMVYNWLSRYQTFELFKLADLAIWPVHHTTLIEDCVAAGLPYLIRKTETTQHLINSDYFLGNGSFNELLDMLERMLSDNSLLIARQAVLKMQSNINYYNVADTVIQYHNKSTIVENTPFNTNVGC